MAKLKNSNFREELKKLREEMKPMTFKQKVDHIWTYYKDYVLVSLPLLLIVVGLIASGISNATEKVVTGIMVNITIDQEGYNYLSTDYEEYLQLEEGQEVKLEYTSFEDLTTSTDTENNYYAAMGVVGEVSAKTLDYMILDGMSMQFYATQEVYGDLRTVFTEEELAYFAENDLLVYCLEEGQTEEWPAAVKIDDLPFVQKYIRSDDSVFFTLSGSSQHLEACRAIWDYINAWQDPTTE